jgi:hypothetical protein
VTARRAALTFATAAALAGCGTAATQGPVTAARVLPQRIMQAPRGLLAVAGPQADGTMWALAGGRAVALFRFGAGGRLAPGLGVSSSARWVAESAGGVLALALGTKSSGALELLSSRTRKVATTTPLPAPAREVVTDGTAFYALAGWRSAASVTVVAAGTGNIKSTVPVPADAVSVAPDPAQGSIYVLDRTGLVSEIQLAGGKVTSRFRVGDDGRAIAAGPGAGLLYVLKGTPQVPNIAVVDAATQSVRRVLPAPSHCRGLVVSGTRLYEVVGTSGYGNIQVFAL